MKKGNILILFILLAFIAIADAQDFKYGKVSKAELQEEVHPLDSSANAAFLYKKEDVSFVYDQQTENFVQEREVIERIKIYNKDGYNKATKKIFLYKGGSEKNEKLRAVKGATYNLKDGKVTKDKLKKDGIFEEKYNDINEIYTLTMPNIQDSSVIEYTYILVSPFSAIDDVYFQADVPINKLEIKVATPQYRKYDKQANLKAFFFPEIVESKETRSIIFSGKSRKENNQNGRTQFDSSKQEYFDNVMKISEENIPAIRAEAYAGNMDNFISKMSLEFSATLNDIGVEQQSFSSSWAKVSKSIYKRHSFGSQIKRVNFFKDDIEAVLSGVEDPFQKGLVLQNFVKSKVKWNGYYGYSAYKGIRSAYNEGEGNIGDINLLLIAMLKSQGVEANPVLISTKNNGIPLFPTTKGFNYVVCMVEQGDSYILLDASEPYSIGNVLPERALNWQGRLIKDDESSRWVSIFPSSQSVESTSLNIKIEDDFTITGKVRQNKTSNLALRYRKNFAGLSNDAYKKIIEKNKGDIVVDNLTLTNAKDIGKPVNVSYDYILSDAIDEIGGKLYFSPMLFMATKESPFKLEERKYPIDFSIPFKDKYKVNIILPKGYKVEGLPKSEIFQFNNGDAKFSFKVRENGSFIQLSVDFDLKTALINPSDYKVFKDFYEKIIEKQAEQIILTKI